MPVLLRIALRNLLEHKAKSFIIGVLLAMGVAVLVVGKAFMDTAARGIKDTFTANYTGDIFIAPKTDEPVSLFGIRSIDRQESVPDLPFYDKIAEKLSGEKEITGFTSQVTSFAMASPKDSDKQGLALLFGIDPATYYKLFHNAYAVEGRLLEPGEEGLMISQYMANRYASADGFRPRIGETLLLTGTGRDGFKIRAVTLVGILGYRTKSEATDLISFADVNTVRILSGLTLGNDPDEPVTAAQKQILDASGDSLFGRETVLPSAAVQKPLRAVAPPRKRRRASIGPIRGRGTSSWRGSRIRPRLEASYSRSINGSKTRASKRRRRAGRPRPAPSPRASMSSALPSTPRSSSRPSYRSSS